MTTAVRRRGLELIEPTVLRAWRMVGRLRAACDDAALDEALRPLVAETEGLVPRTGHRCFTSDEARAAALTHALQALSAVAQASPRGETDEARAVRASAEALGFEVASALWALGRRPEFVCTACGASYLPVGLLACPGCS